MRVGDNVSVEPFKDTVVYTNTQSKNGLGRLEYIGLLG